MEDSHRNNVDIDKLVELWLKWDKVIYLSAYIYVCFYVECLFYI